MKPAKRVEQVSLSGIRKMFELVGENSINMGLGELDFDTPLHIREAAKKALDEGFTHYTSNKGIIELREALSNKLESENQVHADPESIIVTVGASEALYICMQALVDDGEEVMIPDPGFVTYDASVRISGGVPVPVMLKEENEFRMTPEDVLQVLTDKTKAIILNSPSNPTGGVMTREDIKGVAEIADDHDIILISDEVYEKIIYDRKHYSPARFTENAVTINAFSKTYAMTGFRIGYLAASPEISEELLKVHQYNTTCATSISQKAALAALEGPQGVVDEMVAELRKRRDLVVGRLAEMGLSCIEPQGAFYVFPKTSNSSEFVTEALKKDVVLVPGSSCGIYCSDHVRMSYATSYEDLKEAMDRLETIDL